MAYGDEPVPYTLPELLAIARRGYRYGFLCGVICSFAVFAIIKYIEIL